MAFSLLRLPDGVRHLIRRRLRAQGLDIVRFPRIQVMRVYGISHVLDVGANIGQYASELRYFGYAGTISSFEPGSAAFARLRDRAGRDHGGWRVFNYGMSDTDGTLTLQVSENSVSSSLARVLPSLTETDPSSSTVGEECVQLHRLDTVFSQIVQPSDRVMLKIDTQGHEWQVIDGAAKSLSRVTLLQLETSLQPLYENERLLPDVLGRLTGMGFRLVGIEPGLPDRRSGELLQADLLMANGAGG